MTNHSLTETIYSRLKESINSLELLPGTPLRESSLAELFSSSRTPVREALRRLEAEGLVFSVPNRGATVSNVSINDIIDAYEIRELLEPYAVMQATQSGIDPEKVKALLKRQKKLNDNPQTSEELAEREAFDRDLHLFIAEATGNKLLTNIILDMRARMGRVFTHMGQQGRFRHGSQEHEEILKAILDRDGERAAQCMRRHLQRSKAQLLNIDD